MLGRMRLVSTFRFGVGILLFVVCQGVLAADLQPGLKGEYFQLTNAVTDFPKLEGLKPLLVRIDQKIEFRSTGASFPGTLLTNQFAIRWSGKIRIPANSTYTFFLESDDGSRLIIDGKEVIENGGLHSMEEIPGTIILTAGDHDVRIEYYENENDGGAGCVLSWKSKIQAREVVPESVLLH